VAVDGLTAGAVARRLGVAVTTLRTWHQRYGLGPSRHEPGQHRRYSPDDVARLELMQRLTADGVPPGEAARWVRRMPIGSELPYGDERDQPPAGSGGGGSGVDRPANGAARPGNGPVRPANGATRPGPVTGPGPAATNHAPGRAAAPGALTGAPHGPVRGHTAGARGPARRDGGGRALALGRASREARGLARAATRLDSSTVHQILTDAIGTGGVLDTWDEIVRPVLAAVGHRAASTGEMIEVEHVLSHLISTALGTVPRPPRDIPVRVMLACADEEQHSLPLEAAAAALAERGVPSRLLGARVPPTALRAAIRRTGPTAVLLWSHDRSTADLALLRAILSGRGRPLLLMVGGPGWPLDELPRGVATVETLREAVNVLSAAATH